MDVIVHQIEAYLKRIVTDPSTIWVAYSGGLDSHVLLHAICQCRDKFSINVKAIHIDHQLQLQSTTWAEHCLQQCQKLAISCDVIQVDASAALRQSPEDAARQARYTALIAHIANDDILVTAHHQMDQAETLLLQLMRGSGVAGLAAMPEQKHTLISNQISNQINNQIRHDRPLLNCPHEDLLAYAKQHQLDWIQDPSNTDLTIRRNFIRHEIMPKLQSVWPKAEVSLAKSAAYLADALSLQESLLDSLLPGLLLTPDCLDILKLQQLPEIQQRHCLRHWYQSLGLPRPATSLLERIESDVINAKIDAQPRLQFAGSQLLRSQNKLLLLPDWPVSEPETLAIDAEKHIACAAFSLHVTVDRTQLQESITAVMGNYAAAIDLRGQKRALKKYYKEIALPEVLRKVLPLLFVGEQLMLIPGLYKHESLVGIDYEFKLKRFVETEQNLISEIFR